MSKGNKYWFLKGMKDGIPIALGYFAVAITLGIAAVKAGMTPGQASLTSLLLNASAGEFIGFTLIAQNAGYLEVFIMEAVANARYLLMSCALSQKIDPNASVIKRLLVGFNVTDEIFGISISVPDKLNPFYTFGADAVAMPGWALGTLTGGFLGEILYARIASSQIASYFQVVLLSALSVALYGMFVAIFIPPAKKNKAILCTVIAGAVLSYIMSTVKIFAVISAGMRIILLTVVISLAAAILFPVKEGEQNEA